jgi:hypothetical protein
MMLFETCDGPADAGPSLFLCTVEKGLAAAKFEAAEKSARSGKQSGSQ